jgi:hypothetical protein
MSKVLPNSIVLVYAQIFPMIREKAKELGYAIGLHGSMLRDLDLIAMPWIEEAVDTKTLITSIADMLGGHIPYHGGNFINGEWKICDMPSIRPHGRESWTISFVHSAATGVLAPGMQFFIDISVMPTKVK